MQDMEKLVEAVTKEIMRRLESAGPQKILVLGKDESCPIAGCLRASFQADVRPGLEDRENYDFVVLPTWYLDKLTGGTVPAAKEAAPSSAREGGGGVVDLTGKKLIHERELREKCDARTAELRVDTKAIITQLAADYIRQRRLQVTRVG